VNEAELAALQDDHWDLARCFALIVRKAWHDRRLGRVQAIALFTFRQASTCFEPFGSNFHRHVGVRHEVVVPVRASRRPALGRDDDLVVPVASECQRVDALLAALRTGSRQ